MHIAMNTFIRMVNKIQRAYAVQLRVVGDYYAEFEFLPEEECDEVTGCETVSHAVH